jgi:opacity protein-like surface antigen
MELLMIRKTYLFTSSMALLAMLATVSPARADYLSDFYAGGFGGRAWARTDVAGSPTFDLHPDDWGVFAGYNLGDLDPHSNMGLEGGVEAHYAWTSSGSETNGATTLEKKHEWGLDLRPGFAVITQSMPLNIRPYAILGYRQADFNDSVTGSSNHSGFALGAGAELVTYKHFGVRLDYDHVYYRSHDGIDPHENDLRLGLAYHF